MGIIESSYTISAASIASAIPPMRKALGTSMESEPMLDEVDAAMEVSDVTLAGLPLSVVLAVFVAAAVKTRLE
jgi:hypothetical protein